MNHPKMYVTCRNLDGTYKERTKLSPQLLMLMAKRNSINTAKVLKALENGERVYTSFSYYEREVS